MASARMARGSWSVHLSYAALHRESGGLRQVGSRATSPNDCGTGGRKTPATRADRGALRARGRRGGGSTVTRGGNACAGHCKRTAGLCGGGQPLEGAGWYWTRAERAARARRRRALPDVAPTASPRAAVQRGPPGRDEAGRTRGARNKKVLLGPAHRAAPRWNVAFYESLRGVSRALPAVAS